MCSSDLASDVCFKDSRGIGYSFIALEWHDLHFVILIRAIYVRDTTNGGGFCTILSVGISHIMPSNHNSLHVRYINRVKVQEISPDISLSIVMTGEGFSFHLRSF